MFKHIVNDVIELRLLNIDDASTLYKIIDENRSHLRKWLPWIDRTLSVGDTRDYIKYSLKQFSENDGFQAGIWYEGEMVGVIGYHLVNWEHRFTSIGYWLIEAFQGKGIMTKACSAFVEYGFNGMKMNRIEIRCAVENARSRMIPVRLGFKEEGVIRSGEWLYNHYVDHIIYSKLASD